MLWECIKNAHIFQERISFWFVFGYTDKVDILLFVLKKPGEGI